MSRLKVLAPVVPLAVAAPFAVSIVDGKVAGLVSLVATASLAISAFLVLILRLSSPFWFGYFVAAWSYFASLLLQLMPPLWAVCVYLLPSAWTTVGAFYRADQYWPDDYHWADLEFARGEFAGVQLFANAHLLWTGVVGLAGGIAAVCWNWSNSLYIERPGFDPANPGPAQFSPAEILQFTSLCAVIAFLASSGGAAVSFVAVVAFAVMVLVAGTKCACAFVALSCAGTWLFLLLCAT